MVPTLPYSLLFIGLVALLSSGVGLLTRDAEGTVSSASAEIVPGTAVAKSPGSPSEASPANLSSTVVKLSDVAVLSPRYELRNEQSGHWSNETAATEWPDISSALSRYRRWGRLDGYSSVLWQPYPSRSQEAPIEIRSKVSLYRTAQGARDAFKEEQAKLIGPSPQLVTVPRIGDASVAYRVGNGPLITFLVQFQRGRVVGSLLTTSFSDHASLQVAVNLAALMADELQ